MTSEARGERSRCALFDHATPRIAAVARALSLDERAVLEMFDRLTLPWGRSLRTGAPGWSSEIGDDHTPFELSLALGDPHALRIMVEPLGDPPSLRTNRDASLSLLASLAKDFEIDMGRVEQLADLFFPQGPQGRFAMWVAVALGAGRTPQFKVYLNPEAQGRALAPCLVEQALGRLGFSGAWPIVSETIARRGTDRDELLYVSLDATHSADARLKVYARHHGATREDLETAASAAPSHSRGDVTRFLSKVAPDIGDVFMGRGLFTCLSFVGAHGNRPAAVTTHFPINGYARNDLAIRERVLACLEDLGLPLDVYARALEVFANRPLEAGVGLQSYVSFRREDRYPRVTVYLSMEAYRPGTVAPASAPPPPPTARALVARYEEHEPITRHPFLRRMRREPPSVALLWKLLENFRISISKNFARHLASVTARVDSDRIRSILARQLNDELGDGHFEERGHVRLFARMMDQLARWRPSVVGEAMMTPGHNFGRRLGDVYSAPDPYSAVGAVMVGEVFGKQIDQFLGDEFRRQSDIDAASLEWLVLHEKLEVEHAADSFELADCVPPEALRALWEGAHAAALAGWGFLDDLYRVGYGDGMASAPQP
jgi:pyrroloquinoline quinone (PQQ) biosynthesis protein C